METINFIKDYWVQLLFVLGFFIGCLKFAYYMIDSVKCSLRNDILSIYDRCKHDKKITKYQLEAIEYSYNLYKALKGNSFVDRIHEKIKDYEVVD